MAARLTIDADARERAGGVLERLAALDGVDLRVSHLPVGDYLLGDDVGVERKTAGDFVSSIVDRRLFRQVEALQAAFARPAPRNWRPSSPRPTILGTKPPRRQVAKRRD